jgi:hypothetical protein
VEPQLFADQIVGWKKKREGTGGNIKWNDIFGKEKNLQGLASQCIQSKKGRMDPNLLLSWRNSEIP